MLLLLSSTYGNTKHKVITSGLGRVLVMAGEVEVVQYALKFAEKETLHTNRHSHFQHSPVIGFYSPSHNIIY